MEANKLPVALLLIFIAVRLRQVNFPTQSFLFAGIVRVTRGFPGSPKISGLPAAPLSRFSECAGPFLAARWMRGDTHSFKSFTLESFHSSRGSASFVGVSHMDYTNAIVVPQFNALTALERGFNDVPTKFKCSVSPDSQKGFSGWLEKMGNNEILSYASRTLHISSPLERQCRQKCLLSPRIVCRTRFKRSFAGHETDPCRWARALFRWLSDFLSQESCVVAGTDALNSLTSFWVRQRSD